MAKLVSEPEVVALVDDVEVPVGEDVVVLVPEVNVPVDEVVVVLVAEVNVLVGVVDVVVPIVVVAGTPPGGSRCRIRLRVGTAQHMVGVPTASPFVLERNERAPSPPGALTNGIAGVSATSVQVPLPESK